MARPAQRRTSSAKPYPETAFRADVIRSLRELGYLATAIRRSDGVTIGDVGLPDVIACHPVTGAMLTLELKVPPNVASPAQRRWLEAFGRNPRTVARLVTPQVWPDVARYAAELAGHKVHAR